MKKIPSVISHFALLYSGFPKAIIFLLGFTAVFLGSSEWSEAYLLSDHEVLLRAIKLRISDPTRGPHFGDIVTPLSHEKNEIKNDLIYINQILDELNLLVQVQDRVEDELHYPLVRELYSSLGKNISRLSESLKNKIAPLLPNGVHWITLENFSAIYNEQRPLIVPDITLIDGSDLVTDKVESDIWKATNNLNLFLSNYRLLSDHFLLSILTYDLPDLKRAFEEVKNLVTKDDPSFSQNHGISAPSSNATSSLEGNPSGTQAQGFPTDEKDLNIIFSKNIQFNIHPKLTFIDALVSLVRGSASLLQLFNFSSNFSTCVTGPGEQLFQFQIPLYSKITKEHKKNIKKLWKKHGKNNCIVKYAIENKLQSFTYYKAPVEIEITPEHFFGTIRLLGESCTKKNLSIIQNQTDNRSKAITQFCKQFVELRNANEHPSDPQNYFLIKYIESDFKNIRTQFFEEILKKFKNEIKGYISERFISFTYDTLPLQFENYLESVNQLRILNIVKESHQKFQEQEAKILSQRQGELRLEQLRNLKDSAEAKKLEKLSNKETKSVDEDDEGLSLFEDFFDFQEHTLAFPEWKTSEIKLQDAEMNSQSPNTPVNNHLSEGSQTSTSEFDFLSAWLANANKFREQGSAVPFNVANEFKLEINEIRKILSPFSNSSDPQLRDRYLKNAPFRFSLDHHFVRAIALIKCFPSKEIPVDLSLYKKARNLIMHYSWLDDSSTNLPFLPMENMYERSSLQLSPGEYLPPAYFQSAIILEANFKLISDF